MVYVSKPTRAIWRYLLSEFCALLCCSLSQFDVNVICVDWSAGAADPNYVRAAVNTRLVGRQVALLVKSINESFGQNINGRTHIVGFSLGAHVAGFAGNNLQVAGGITLSRITG